MKYKVKVPPTREQGSYDCTVDDSHGESKAQAALWYYNSARDHDGLPPISRMPAGTEYTPIKEYVLWADYGQGWEEETIEETRREILQRLREYRENAPQYCYRWTSRPVK